MASTRNAGGLEAFARAHSLAAGSGGELPTTGSLLGRGELGLDGAVNGELPGGEAGVLLACTWETRSDDTTQTHRRTAVAIRLPESIGYAPYLQIGGLFGLPAGGIAKRKFEPAEGVRVIVAEGVDQGWLTELFSPAFSEWLQRNPDGFGAELDAGVLVVAREGHLSAEEKLVQLCEDAARIAREIREEALEEVEAGGGAVAKADAPDRRTRVALALVGELGLEQPPANVESALGVAQVHARRAYPTFVSTISGTLVIMLAVNVVGGGIYGLLLTVGDPLTNVLVYQAILLVVIGFFRYRHVANDTAAKTATEAFWQGYERQRGLREVDPLRFSAEHAEAGLPGKPTRVLEGPFGGAPGFLMLTGDGRKRGDRIALVRGPKGPTAVTELDVAAPGVSTATLDEHIATLLLDLETAPPATNG